MSGKHSFEEVIDKHGALVYKTSGISMLPMLRQNRDIVFIEKPDGRLKKYDVALYKRGKKYILHRVIAVRENDYVIRGDNTYQKEYGISDSDVIGVLSAFVRDEKKYSVNDRGYKLYSRIWNAIYPVRLMYRYVRHFLGKIKRYIFD